MPDDNGITVIEKRTAATDAAPPAALDAPAQEFPLKSRDVPITELLAALPDTPSRDQYVKAIVEQETARLNFNQDYRLARMFALSGKFDDLKGQSPDQAVATAMVKVQLGRSWGLEPADAVKHIYWTNGRPAIENEILASKMRDAGIDWDIEWHEETVQVKGKPWKKCVGCTLWLKVWTDSRTCLPMLDRNGNQVSESFGELDAENAKIWEKGQQIPLSQKWNYQSWGRDMYFWRAVSRVRKYHATNVLRGAVARAEVYDVPLEEETPMLEGAAPEVVPQEGDASVQPASPAVSLQDQVLHQLDLLGGKPPEPEEKQPKKRKSEYPD